MKYIQLFIVFSFASFNLFSQDGVVKSYYENGKIESEINFAAGIREGQAQIFFYENGNLKEERIYGNGKVEGVVRTYHENGKLKTIIDIVDGRREGPTSIFKEDGIYDKDINYKAGIFIPNIPEPEEAPEKIIASSEDKEEELPEVETIIKKTENKPSLPFPPVINESESGDDPAFYLTAEVMPEPVGGMQALLKKIYYPETAKENEIQGVVKIKVFIDQVGEVEKAEIVEGIGSGCDEAAQIAVYYTKFKPGLQKGKPVKIQMVIPVEFKLN